VRALLDLACDFAAAVDAHGDPRGGVPEPSPAKLARIARRSSASYAGAVLSLLVGLFMTYGAVVSWSVARRSRSVEALIVRSEVPPGGRPEITYRYAVGGSTYESPLYPRLGDGLGEEQVRALVESHPAGQRLIVYYDCAASSRSRLERPKAVSIVPFFAAIWAASGLLLFFALRGV